MVYPPSPLTYSSWATLTHHSTRTSTKTLEIQFPGAILHCEDKRASSLRIFCPCLYFQAITNTFLDSAVFGPDEVVSSLVSTLLRAYGKSYPWALGKGRQLPAGYILAKKKKKKGYQSGRPTRPFLLSTLHFDLCSTSLPGRFFNSFQWPAPQQFPTGDAYALL